MHMLIIINAIAITYLPMYFLVGKFCIKESLEERRFDELLIQCGLVGWMDYNFVFD